MKKAAPAPAPNSGVGGPSGIDTRNFPELTAETYGAGIGQQGGLDLGADQSNIAAVLNAMDEDNEEGEEAEVPGEFEYESQDEEEEK